MFEDMDWKQVAPKRDKWRAVVTTNEPSGSIKVGEFLEKLNGC
jgi:hypothetical protein